MVGYLIENAIIYTQASGSVGVSVDSKNGNVMYAVEDNGPGISEAHWPQISEGFLRPSPTVGEGCGLGLAIVREIATAHSRTLNWKPAAKGAEPAFSFCFKGSDPFYSPV